MDFDFEISRFVISKFNNYYYRNEFDFCGFYRCINAGESLKI